MKQRLWVCLSALMLTGCGTEVKRLELQRDQLLRVEQATLASADLAEAKHFEADRYDLYLKIAPQIFETLLASFDNTKVPLEVSGRDVEFDIRSVRLLFETGQPMVKLDVAALDRATGVTAELEFDAYALIGGDDEQPGALYLQLVATRVVPNLRWGLLDLGKWRFARALMSLEATRLTEKLPRVELPLRKEFAFGGPAQTRVVQLPVKGGNVAGNVHTPGVEVKGALAVKQVLFLENGVHVFADVEGL